jgi:hypothetical protein
LNKILSLYSKYTTIPYKTSTPLHNQYPKRCTIPTDLPHTCTYLQYLQIHTHTINSLHHISYHTIHDHSTNSTGTHSTSHLVHTRTHSTPPLGTHSTSHLVHIQHSHMVHVVPILNNSTWYKINISSPPGTYLQHFHSISYNKTLNTVLSFPIPHPLLALKREKTHMGGGG